MQFPRATRLTFCLAVLETYSQNRGENLQDTIADIRQGAEPLECASRVEVIAEAGWLTLQQQDTLAVKRSILFSGQIV